MRIDNLASLRGGPSYTHTLANLPHPEQGEHPDLTSVHARSQVVSIWPSSVDVRVDSTCSQCAQLDVDSFGRCSARPVGTHAGLGHTGGQANEAATLRLAHVASTQSQQTNECTARSSRLPALLVEQIYLEHAVLKATLRPCPGLIVTVGTVSACFAGEHSWSSRARPYARQQS